MASSNLLRIIGGEWRGRKLRFPDVPHLRPTPDRVRETAFNWLMPVIDGARCLDLFAGSGAMGLEALSRGAAHVTFVELNRKAADAISEHLKVLGANADITSAEVLNFDAMKYLAKQDEKTAKQFDIVFLDPPYKLELMQQTVKALNEANLLAPAAKIYLEIEKRQQLPELPQGWEMLKDKTAGEVHYFLYQRQS